MSHTSEVDCESEILSESAIRVLSLFSGCGGMDLGMEGGFEFLDGAYERLTTETVGAVEFDPQIASLYRSNFSTPLMVGDIRDIAAEVLPEHDILTGGFPCQSFSIVAQNPPRLGHDDEKGKLYFEMCRILNHHKPEAFIAENVKGLMTANGGTAFPLIVEEFESCGYYVKWKLLHAENYGVPQKRRRVFIVGFRDAKAAEEFSFPVPTHEDGRAVLGDVLEPSWSIPEEYYFSDKAIQGLSNSRLSKVMKKGRVQDHESPCNTVGAHLAKRSLNSTDPVVRTGGRVRMFTPREVARIQSFPENFKLGGVKTTDYRALGNAVPPVLMWHVAKSVLLALRR